MNVTKRVIVLSTRARVFIYLFTFKIVWEIFSRRFSRRCASTSYEKGLLLPLRKSAVVMRRPCRVLLWWWIRLWKSVRACCFNCFSISSSQHLPPHIAAEKRETERDEKRDKKNCISCYSATGTHTHTRTHARVFARKREFEGARSPFIQLELNQIEESARGYKLYIKPQKFARLFGYSLARSLIRAPARTSQSPAISDLFSCENYESRTWKTNAIKIRS